MLVLIYQQRIKRQYGINIYITLIEENKIVVTRANTIKNRERCIYINSKITETIYNILMDNNNTKKTLMDYNKHINSNKEEQVVDYTYTYRKEVRI